MKKNLKEGLEKLASDLYNIGEVELTKDVYRVISTIPDEEKKESNKKISSIKDIELAKKDLSKLFSK